MTSMSSSGGSHTALTDRARSTREASGSWLAPLCYSVATVSNRVGVRELRQRASAVLKRVVNGEVIEVTDHGHPIARIVPLRPGLLDQLVLEGRATEAMDDLLDMMDELGLPQTAEVGHQLPSQALAELRADER